MRMRRRAKPPLRSKQLPTLASTAPRLQRAFRFPRAGPAAPLPRQPLRAGRLHAPSRQRRQIKCEPGRRFLHPLLLPSKDSQPRSLRASRRRSFAPPCRGGPLPRCFRSAPLRFPRRSSPRLSLLLEGRRGRLCCRRAALRRCRSSRCTRTPTPRAPLRALAEELGLRVPPPAPLRHRCWRQKLPLTRRGRTSLPSPPTPRLRLRFRSP